MWLPCTVQRSTIVWHFPIEFRPSSISCLLFPLTAHRLLFSLFRFSLELVLLISDFPSHALLHLTWTVHYWSKVVLRPQHAIPIRPILRWFSFRVFADNEFNHWKELVEIQFVLGSLAPLPARSSIIVSLFSTAPIWLLLQISQISPRLFVVFLRTRFN